MGRNQERRKAILDKIVSTLSTLEDKNLVMTDLEFVYQICEETGCSIRTAKEYYKIGKMRYDRVQSTKTVD